MVRKILACAAAVSAASASAADGQRLAFVECPIVRDTASVPCWLSEYDGELYYMGIQTDVSADFHPPSLGHKVLVEGTVSDEPRICGGVVLKDVVVSVMQERADDCNTLLMAEDRYKLPFEAPRPPGPSLGRLAFDNTPARAPRAPQVPQPPYQAKSFDIPFDFNGRIAFKHPRFLSQVMTYAKQINASRISVTGYRGATRLSNGELLSEQEQIAERRATQVADLLKGAGLTTPQYKVEWKTRAETGDHTKRRVTVTVAP
ncbi:hypothetical protein [Tsuneonella sp. HG222]